MKNGDYGILDFLKDTISDLENIENEVVSDVKEDLENALEEASQNLKQSLEKLLKALKKEVLFGVLNFYHENKKLINKDLKSLNAFVMEVLSEVKHELKEDIHNAGEEGKRKVLRELRDDVVRFSRKYNHAYHKLRLKLALGNAGVAVKDFFN